MSLDTPKSYIDVKAEYWLTFTLLRDFEPHLKSYHSKYGTETFNHVSHALKIPSAPGFMTVSKFTKEC